MTLSDEDLGFVLKGKGKKLHDENKDRNEIAGELAQLLADEDGVLEAKSERLISSGRASFGRANEGREGLALFVPADGESSD